MRTILKSQQAFADAIGVSRPFVSKCLKKYERLRGYGLHDILNLDNEVDMKEKTSNHLICGI